MRLCFSCRNGCYSIKFGLFEQLEQTHSAASYCLQSFMHVCCPCRNGGYSIKFGLYEWSPWPWGGDRRKRSAADTLVSQQKQFYS